MNLEPVIISLKTSVIATFITFFLGIYAARFIKNHGSKYRWILDTIFTLPMVLPPTVVGFFLLIVLGNNGPLSSLYEKFNFSIVFSYPATIISAVVVSFPLMYRTSLGAFEQINSNYIEASRTLGFSEEKIFWKIIIPLSKPGLISGAILSFARALGEFGATIMIAGNIEGKTQTIPIAIYSAVQSGNRSLAYNWSIVVVGISIFFMILLNLFSKGDKYVN